MLDTLITVAFATVSIILFVFIVLILWAVTTSDIVGGWRGPREARERTRRQR